VDTAEANELFELAERLSADAKRLRDALEREFLSGQLEEIFRRDYDLGPVVRIEQIFGGYVNQSFAVWTRTHAGEHKYFVCKYNKAIIQSEVLFQHRLVNHIVRGGFHMAAQVFATKTGGTFATREETFGGQKIVRFFAVFALLGGEDKYTWVKNRCTDREYENSARALAQFHHYGQDFDPGDVRREQPPIMELVPTLAETFTGCCSQATGSRFDEYLLPKMPAILRVIEKGAEIAPLLRGLPFLPVHCDYHPGNLKYADEEVVGMFDFDWSKLDYRLFDVGLGIAYFCSSWSGEDSGELWLDKAAVFVRAYQDEAAKFAAPGPMSEVELGCLPRMIANANLFVLNWDITAYYADKNPDDDEYLTYLEHNVKLMEFIEGHEAELAHIATSVHPTDRPAASQEGSDQG
jgi:homoserine kinase type II